MINSFNINENNLSITMKVADLKALFYYWQDEWAKKLAEANKVKEKQEWYNSRETAQIFKKSICHLQPVDFQIKNGSDSHDLELLEGCDSCLKISNSSGQADELSFIQLMPSVGYLSGLS